MATPPVLPNFSLGDFMGSHPSWSSCFPWRGLIRTPGMGQRAGWGRGQLELRNAGLESELLRNQFSHPAPVPAPLGFSWRAVGDLGSRRGHPCLQGLADSAQAQGYPLLGGQPKAVSCQTQGPDPAEALSHLKVSWPGVAHPRGTEAGR